VKDGRAVAIAPDKDHPISKGYICSKAYGALELEYHHDRLLHPMKRAGRRGEGKWEKISWGQAFSTIADKLNQLKQVSGAESVVFAHGTGRDFHRFVYRVANLFGTPNVMSPGHMCYVPRVAICHAMGMEIPLCDYENHPGIIVAWGSDHLVSNPDENKGINLAKEVRAGSKLIVVNPRRIGIADKADMFLQVRPATDTALALGMARVIVKDELYDKKFIEDYSFGFDKFAQRIEKYDPKTVEEITWVPSNQVVEAAHLYATTKPACIQWGVGIEQNLNCVDADRSLIYLVAMTGNLDVPGGNVTFGLPPVLPRSEFSLFASLPPGQRAKMLGGEKYKLAASIGRLTPHTVWDAILDGNPYRVRALVVFASNLLLARENARRAYRALKEVEFFVACDIFKTPTTEMADIVLPAATWLENDNIADYWKIHGYVFPRVKAVEPLGEARPDHVILNELGKRLGFPEFFWDTYEESLDFILKPANLRWTQFKNIPYLRSPVEFRKYEKKGFDTKTGKFEFYLTKYEEWGYDPLPDYNEPPESPKSDTEFVKRYPLVLTTGHRIFEFFGSEHRQSPSLRKRHPDPLIEINTNKGHELGIKDGAWVRIESPRGSIRMKARLTDRIDPRVVSAEYGWWYPEREAPGFDWQESNINILTSDADRLDAGMGATNLRGLMCNVRPLGE